MKSSFEFAERFGSRSGGYRDLMREQVRSILFVSSLYESFIMAEDGRLNELILSKYLDLDLRQAPDLTRVSSGREALSLLRSSRRFDLLITSPRVADMNAAELAREVKTLEQAVPVVLLAYDHRELNTFVEKHGKEEFERTFLWQGDARLFLAMVKSVEDRLNVAQDTKLGVPVFLVVEDNVRYYSSFLPVIYTEVMNLTESVFSEGGVNLLQRLLRMRARPKILLATTFEEAWRYFHTYRNDVLGVISDIEFPRRGEPSDQAGIALARAIREVRGDVPIALQSADPGNAELARSLDASFIQKGSPEMLGQLQEYLTEHLFFGDFVFRLPDGSEVGRASDLKGLVEQLRTIPAESLVFHGQRNDFSSWLRTRGEFGPASQLRPRRISDFDSLEHLREELIESIDRYRRERNRSTVSPFDPDTFDGEEGIAQIGEGSLGGKGRGLAFVMRLLDEVRLASRFEGVDIKVPPAVVLGTRVFTEFLDANDLRSFSLKAEDDDRVVQAFLDASFPPEHREQLRAFLRVARYPLAVRSSSLLEDSPYQPFAGIYSTYILPNDDPDPDVRLGKLVTAIKRVYASTFSRASRAFLDATPYRLEEEQMGVIVQKMVGRRHGNLFYPTVAGVARSRNFYPSDPARSEDGVAAVALGLGRTVAEGDPCHRFAPPYPRHAPEISSPDDLLRSSQRRFWALWMGPGEPPESWGRVGELVSVPVATAEEHGTLRWVGSTFSPENEAVYDGTSREGTRLVTFAPILKHELFPLAEILEELLIVGSAGCRSEVEIEFAVDLGDPREMPKEFGFLQLRPVARSREWDEVEIDVQDTSRLLCRSPSVLGNGRLENLRDVVVVDRDRFERARSRACAAAVGYFNRKLAREDRPYLLVGVGRWGSSHPRMGIPVRWDEISGAAVIVEAGLKDFRVTPSQGTHFFQNLSSFDVGYFTVNARTDEGFVDWEWLDEQPAVEEEEECVRHLRFQEPLTVTMNGKTREGIIEKPGG